MARTGKKTAKRYRVAGRKGAAGEMPSAEEMRDGMGQLQQVMQAQRKRGFRRRSKRTRRS